MVTPRPAWLTRRRFLLGAGTAVGVGAADAAGTASRPSTTAPPTARASGLSDVSGLAVGRLAWPDTGILRRARPVIPLVSLVSPMAMTSTSIVGPGRGAAAWATSVEH